MLNPADLAALTLSLKLATATSIILLVVGLPLAWWLSRTESRIKPVIEALVALPLILPPTVLGFYLLIALGSQGPIGQFWIATFGQPATTLSEEPAAQTGLPAPYYVRMALQDKPGALAKVAAALGDAGVSIHRMRQYDHATTVAPVLIVTHKCTSTMLEQALEALAATGVVEGAPVALRIEEL